MKELFLCVLLLVGTRVSYAQKAFILEHQPKNGFITVSSGISLPTEKFAMYSTRDPEAGLAKQGTMASLSAGYRVIGKLGLMVRGELFQNRVEREALLDGLYNLSNDAWSAKAGYWAVSSVTAGPYVNFPLGRWSVQLRATAGQAQGICPGTRLKGQFLDIPMTIKNSDERAVAVAYNGGVTVRYRLGRSTAFQLNSDYTRSDLTFRDMKASTTSGRGQGQTNIMTTTKPITVVHLSVGLTVLFGNQQRVF